MFNHYFFGGDASRSVYLEFLRKCSSEDAGDLLVVVDPPFGGHVTVIAFTLQCITDDYKNLHQGIMLLYLSNLQQSVINVITVLIVHFFDEICKLVLCRIAVLNYIHRFGLLLQSCVTCLSVCLFICLTQ